MRAAVDAVEARRGRRRRAGQQRRLRPVGRGRVRADGRRPARSSRPTCSASMRLCQLVLPGMRAPALGADRQHLLDGRQADVPGRRRLPRHQVRRGGALATRCASRCAGFGVDVVVIEPGLIRPSFGDDRGRARSSEARRRRPVRRVQRARSRRRTERAYERARWRGSAAVPTRSPRRSRRRSRAARPRPATPSRRRRAAADEPARAAAGPGVGRGAAHAVPDTRRLSPLRPSTPGRAGAGAPG